MPNPSEERPPVERIICALILGADHPITPSEIQKILESVEEEDRAAALEAETDVTDADLEAAQADRDRQKPADAASDATPPPPGEDADTAAPPPDEQPDAETAEPLRLETETPKTLSIAAIRRILSDMQTHFRELNLGMALIEVAGGYRFQTDPDCGRWVRRMLNKGKPARLPRPAIETLAIIAYRQPVTRSEIESIRGVSAGHVIKALMEMQLVRILGRSDLPGRPFLFGTTPAFLSHFGLGSLKELGPIKQ